MSHIVSFFTGNVSAFNVRRTLRNIGSVLSPEFELHLVVCSSGLLDEEIRDRFHVFQRNESDNISGEMGTLAAYLRNHDPTVIQQLTAPVRHGILVGSIAKVAGVPSVYTYAGDRFGAYRARQSLQSLPYFAYNNLLGRIGVELADSYVVLGPHGRMQLKKRGISDEKITVLPPMISRDTFHPGIEPAELPFVEPDDKVILFAGRVSDLKGLETLERAIPEVLRERKDVHFVLVGPRVREPRLPGWARNRVTAVGAVDPPEMPHYYSAADLVVLPSFTEGTPLVLIEALLCGVPVVGRDVGDVSFITQNTFETDEEFVELLSDFESLPTESGERFTCNSLSSRYAEFYRDFTV